LAVDWTLCFLLVYIEKFCVVLFICLILFGLEWVLKEGTRGRFFGNQEGTIARNSKIPMKKGIDLMGFKYVLVSTPTENHDPN
jgi:uncharacterized membrane protein